MSIARLQEALRETAAALATQIVKALDDDAGCSHVFGAPDSPFKCRPCQVQIVIGLLDTAYAALALPVEDRGSDSQIMLALRDLKENPWDAITLRYDAGEWGITLSEDDGAVVEIEPEESLLDILRAAQAVSREVPVALPVEPGDPTCLHGADEEGAPCKFCGAPDTPEPATESVEPRTCPGCDGGCPSCSGTKTAATGPSEVDPRSPLGHKFRPWQADLKEEWPCAIYGCRKLKAAHTAASPEPAKEPNR